MTNRSLIPLKLEKFYKEVSEKHKNKKMRLQTDLEFKQKSIMLKGSRQQLEKEKLWLQSKILEN